MKKQLCLSFALLLVGSQMEARLPGPNHGKIMMMHSDEYYASVKKVLADLFEKNCKASETDKEQVEATSEHWTSEACKEVLDMMQVIELQAEHARQEQEVENQKTIKKHKAIHRR